ncbi:MAG: glycosyltransferase family A protein [Cyanobacteriota bacterium]|nr:glycosyltransferase family A protein [Cyanobacteriota bacterium]
MRQLIHPWPGEAAWPLLSLGDEGSTEATVLLIPATWSGGLGTVTHLPTLKDIEAQTTPAEAPTLWRQVGAGGPRSRLNRQLSRYVQALATCGSPEDLVRLLQMETHLRRRFSPRLWRSLGARSAGTPMEGLHWQRHHGLQLAAVLHLLPADEQEPWLRRMGQELANLLNQPDRRQDGLELTQWLVGSVNSRDPDLTKLAMALRRRAIQVASDLDTAASRAKGLMALIDTPTRQANPEVVDGLVSAIEEMVTTMRQQPPLSDAERRQRRGELQEVIQAAGTNSWLLHAVLMGLGNRVSRLLPGMLTRESSGQLLQALLMVRSDELIGNERQATRLTTLAEGLLPRLWWTDDEILRMIHGLRRFTLDLEWLWSRSGLLQQMVKLHAGGLVGQAMMPTQLMGLGWLAEDPQIQLKIYGQISQLDSHGEAGQDDSDPEWRILQAIACGQETAACSRLRLLASSLGVEDILPMPSSQLILESKPSLTGRWRACIDSWKHTYANVARLKVVPVCVVITTLDPCIELLSLAIESLLMQTAPPHEILIIDDGSSRSLIFDLEQHLNRTGHSSTLIRYHRNDSNQGQYRCRNMASTMTQLPFIAIQDDDDISHPRRLETQWKAISAGCLAHYCSHIRINGETGQLQADGDSKRIIGDGIATLFIDRDVISRLGGFYPVRSRGDVEFRARLKQVYGESSIVHSPKPLYLMRGSAATVSSSFEYGCSLQLKTWRALVRQGLLV